MLYIFEKTSHPIATLRALNKESLFLHAFILLGGGFIYGGLF